MRANKTHISLETAQLLKDCGVESEYYWSEQLQEVITKEQFESYDPYNQDNLQDDGFRQAVETTFKIYTWQEILIEKAKDFFGEEIMHDINTKTNKTGEFARLDLSFWVYHPRKILYLLQQKKYEEADLYFRKHCILIKRK